MIKLFVSRRHYAFHFSAAKDYYVNKSMWSTFVCQRQTQAVHRGLAYSALLVIYFSSKGHGLSKNGWIIFLEISLNFASGLVVWCDEVVPQCFLCWLLTPGRVEVLSWPPTSWCCVCVAKGCVAEVYVLQNMGSWREMLTLWNDLQSCFETDLLLESEQYELKTVYHLRTIKKYYCN